MIFQPTLDRNLMSTQDIHYVLHHSCLYTTPNNPKNDEAHIHSCYEIYVNLSGDVSFLVNDRLYSIKRGDIILTRPGDVHLCLYQTTCTHEHYCLWLDAPKGSPFIAFMHKELFSHHISLGHTSMEHCLQLLAKLSDSTDSQTSASDLLRKTASLLDLSLLLESDSLIQDGGYSPQISAEFKNILSYLNTHFDEIQYVHQIYDLFYVSPATLTRWFRKYIHISPREFLESKKLAHARQLLNEGSSVTQAAMQSGFSDCSYFITVFKKRFGMTPKEFKK